MNNPLVSIIMPCWNAEDHIGEAVESALGQTYLNTETIVVNDGSTDHSEKILESFGDKIKVYTQDNLGAGAARNKGFEISNGEFIQFLDSDDLLDKDKLKHHVPEALKDLEVITYCSRYVINISLELNCTCAPVEVDPLSLCLKHVIHTSAPVYPRQMINQIGGYRNLDCCQDYDFHIRLALAGYDFRHLDKVLFTVRRRPESISSDNVKVFRRMTALWQELVETLEIKEQLTPHIKSELARLFSQKARWFLRKQLRQEAKDCFSWADKLDPDAALEAYGKSTRLLKLMLGAERTESISQFYRRLRYANHV